MTSLLNMTGTAGEQLIVTGAVFLLVIQIFICLQARRQHRSKPVIFLHILHSVIGFFFTACLVDGVYRKPELPYTRIAPAVRLLLSLPWGVIVAAELISAIILIIAYRDNRSYGRSHMLPSAIKEAVDLLPEGICFARVDGTVVLHNLGMDALCRSVTGKPLTDINLLWDAVCAESENQNGQRLMRTGGSTFIFARDSIAADGESYIQMLASDITEQYRITEELSANNARLRDIQLRMKLLQVKASQMFLSREIMNARTIVHDEVGHALLSARYYLEHPENTDEEGLLTLMRRTNDILLQEKEDADSNPRDRLEEAVNMAKGIGVTVYIDGTVPKVERYRELLGRAVGECAANTVKHAGGDTLWVKVIADEKKITVTIRNNGDPPREPVTETGGLLSLRRKAEDIGAMMTVGSLPEFSLTITLP